MIVFRRGELIHRGLELFLEAPDVIKPGSTLRWHTQDDNLLGEYMHIGPATLEVNHSVAVTPCGFLVATDGKAFPDAAWVPPITPVTCLACLAWSESKYKETEIRFALEV